MDEQQLLEWRHLVANLLWELVFCGIRLGESRPNLLIVKSNTVNEHAEVLANIAKMSFLSDDAHLGSGIDDSELATVTPVKNSHSLGPNI